MSQFFWNPKDTLRLRDEQLRLSASYRKATLLIPTQTSSGAYDSFTDSPTDIADTAVDASGKVTSSWKIVVINVRVGGPTFTELVLNRQAQASYQEGDVKLYFRLTDEDSIQQVVDSQNAYILLDGLRYRPFSSISRAGLFQADERMVSCRKISARITATGY